MIMQDKVVVVTGAGGSIGRQIALQMAQAGAKVVVNDLGCALSGEGVSAGPAEQTAQMIREAGFEAIVSTDSVGDWDGAHHIIQAALDGFGRIDAVVNAAGTLFFTSFEEIGRDEWLSIVNVHLNGAFYISRATVPHFLKQGGGNFVHFTSSSGLFGRRQQAHYAAAKLGVTAMSRTVAMEFADRNIRSNCIAPIAVSRMADIATISDQARQALAKLSPAQIAPLAVYLASDVAKDVNAQIFSVRGNEVFLVQQCHPLEGMQEEAGWSVEKLRDNAMPRFSSNFVALRGEDEKIIFSNGKFG